MRIPTAVALGGALGAVARYLMVGRFEHWLGAGFPYGTLTANVLGSLLMGMLIEVLALVWSPSPELCALLVVGLLGSFTTFSALSYQTVFLMDKGLMLPALAGLLGNVVLGLLVAYLGVGLARSM